MMFIARPCFQVLSSVKRVTTSQNDYVIYIISRVSATWWCHHSRTFQSLCNITGLTHIFVKAISQGIIVILDITQWYWRREVWECVSLLMVCMSELGHYVMWCNLFDWGYRRMFGESRSQLAGILHNWNMLYRSVSTALRISFTFKCMPHVVKKVAQLALRRPPNCGMKYFGSVIYFI